MNNVLLLISIIADDHTKMRDVVVLNEYHFISEAAGYNTLMMQLDSNSLRRTATDNLEACILTSG